ncbi:MAG: hypothetical protein KGV51_00970 [Moraxellaceae bacterium]|nr:hypothetical protein [Moraxellaceae bacterium]
MNDDEKDYIKFLTELTGAIMKSLKEHGLIPTIATICVLCFILTMLVLAWQLPEIILAIKQ